MNAPISDPPQALIVAAEARVRDDLVKLLCTTRLEAASTDHIDGCIARIPSGTALVVLHPDGFRFDQVVGILFALRRERPEVHTVLVTEKPERFAKLIVAADNVPPPSIVPMSAPAWSILEAAACAAEANAQRRHREASSSGAKRTYEDLSHAAGPRLAKESK
ncbi:MAG TPA: hypothetical protein VGC79_16340 [Polyangiaceae bacterium]